MPWPEGKLLNTARMGAEVETVRRMPRSTEAAVQSVRLGNVPEIVPNTRDIASFCPTGVL